LSAAYWAVADDYLRASIDDVVAEVLNKEESATADGVARTNTLTDYGIDDCPGLFLSVLEALTMLQMLFASVGMVILIFLGPLFIPWLFFQPGALLLWVWGKTLVLYWLYGVLCGAVLSGLRACLEQC
ncbi:MAG: type IV secretion system protein, partial [Acidobacteria bacterium]|nr:type IV secretion system protein [Acidobacteriota bacterium]